MLSVEICLDPEGERLIFSILVNFPSIDHDLMSEQDHILWLRVRDDDRNAFGLLYRQSIGQLLRYGQGITKDENVVEETAQQVYVQFWQERKKIEIRTSFQAYLLRSFRRQLLKNLQSRRQVVELPFSAPVQLTPSYEEQLLAKEHQKARETRLKTATQTLSPRQREAIFLKFYQQIPSAEIAEVMGLQIGAVYKLLSTGLKRLRESF